MKRKNVLKIGAIALVLLLLVGSVFAGNVASQSQDVGNEPTRDLFKWAEKHYNNPGKQVYKTKDKTITINVIKQGKTANVVNIVEDSSGNNLLSSNITIEKMSDSAYKIVSSKGKSRVITPGTTLIDPVVDFSYYVGSYPNTYAGSDSHSECGFTWSASDTSKLSTSTGHLSYDGHDIAFVKVFGVCWIGLHVDTLSRITDTKGYDSGEMRFWEADDDIFYPYSNTYTWKTVEVNWRYAIL